MHLVNSLQLLNKIVRYPKFILKYKFAVCNRANRDYERVVNRYQQKFKENRENERRFNSK